MQERFPIIEPVRSGWMARGDGWAVQGETEEDARRRYEEAKRRHREIDARVVPANGAEPGATGSETPG